MHDSCFHIAVFGAVGVQSTLVWDSLQRLQTAEFAIVVGEILICLAPAIDGVTKYRFSPPVFL